MSWSCRNRADIRRRIVACALAGGGVCCGAAAAAADVQSHPLFEARVETNTNRYLADVEADESDATGYLAEFAWLVEARTPRGETTIRPGIRVQEYDDTSEIENLEGAIDLLSAYRWERSRFEVGARASHEDVFNSELAQARFNDVDPEDPTAPESGNLDAGQTRDRVRVTPTFVHDISQRSALGGGLLYEAAWFDGDSTAVTDYTFAKGDLLYRWKAGPRAELQVGPYVSRYDAKDDATKYDAYGLAAVVSYDWSEALSANVELSYEENDVEDLDPTTSDSESGFGAILTVLRKGETSRMRLVTGRLLTPSSRGRKIASDELRLQYDRDFSQRLSLRLAARYLTQSGLGDAVDADDRDFARADVKVDYWLAREWYLTGGFRYIWQDREQDIQDADNSSFLLGFGYRGGGQQRR